MTELPRSEFETALGRLPSRQRSLLRRTEIDRAPHKVVAAELKLSMRQFYRERAAAVRSIIAAASRETAPNESRVIPSIPVRHRMQLLAVSAAIERNDTQRLTAALEILSLARSSMPSQLVPFVNVVLGFGDAVTARLSGDSERAVAHLADVATSMRDVRPGEPLTPLVSDGLTAMLSLAQEKLDGGETDAAFTIATDVEVIAAHLIDTELEIQAQTILVNAYLCFPCSTDEAYTRAITAMRRCAGTMSAKTIVGSLRALASAVAELGCRSDALALRDIAEPLAATLLNEAERRRHRLWCASIELQYGSPSRAIVMAESIRRTAPSSDRIWTAATILMAHGFTRLGQYQQSSDLAKSAERLGHRYGLQRVVGEAQLICARNAFATGNLADAQAFVIAAIPLLDRAVPSSTQVSAYELSSELTRDPLHAILATQYRKQLRGE
jgi:hypothetical protein